MTIKQFVCGIAAIVMTVASVPTAALAETSHDAVEIPEAVSQECARLMSESGVKSVGVLTVFEDGSEIEYGCVAEAGNKEMAAEEAQPYAVTCCEAPRLYWEHLQNHVYYTDPAYPDLYGVCAVVIYWKSQKCANCGTTLVAYEEEYRTGGCGARHAYL